MKVLCKKTYNKSPKFKKGNWYDIDMINSIYDNNRVINSYLINGITHSNRFVFGYYWDSKLNSKSIKFSDYFYTPKELRREKLLKLNESR